MCRSRQELSNEYLLAKFGFGTAENEPCKVCPLSVYGLPSRLCVLYVETLTGVLFWSFDLLGNIFEQLVFHLRPSQDYYYYYYYIPSGFESELLLEIPF